MNPGDELAVDATPPGDGPPGDADADLVDSDLEDAASQIDKNEPLRDLANVVDAPPAPLFATGEPYVPPLGADGWMAMAVAIAGGLVVFAAALGVELILVGLVVMVALQPGWHDAGAVLRSGFAAVLLGVLPFLAARESFRGTLRLYTPERQLALQRRRQWRRMKQMREAIEPGAATRV
jgi:hypothetical protein